MLERDLRGARILVAEDEYFLADDLCRTLEDAGAEVAGPVASVDQALRFVADATPIDAAVLDVNLLDGKVFAVADALTARGVPFAFATGYDQSALPERFGGAVRIEKPCEGAKVLAQLAVLLSRGGTPPAAVG